MKEYPSIPREFADFQAYIFDKLDGSNVRFEWVRKKGWVKFGSRHHLIDETDLQLGEVKPLFLNTIADKLEKVAVDQRWDRIIAYAEFYGPNSFAGYHVKEDPKSLTIFDINVHKKGILGPREFLKIFDGGDIPIPHYFGIHHWTRGLVNRVYEGNFPVTFEGVIGKAGEGHKLVMAKAKTKAWIDKVKGRFTNSEEILNS